MDLTEAFLDWAAQHPQSERVRLLRLLEILLRETDRLRQAPSLCTISFHRSHEAANVEETSMPRKNGRPVALAQIRSEPNEPCLHCYDWYLEQGRKEFGMRVTFIGNAVSIDGTHEDLTEAMLQIAWRAGRYWDAVQGRPNVR